MSEILAGWGGVILPNRGKSSKDRLPRAEASDRDSKNPDLGFRV